jgi:hypothetical protein
MFTVHEVDKNGRPTSAGTWVQEESVREWWENWWKRTPWAGLHHEPEKDTLRYMFFKADKNRFFRVDLRSVRPTPQTLRKETLAFEDTRIPHLPLIFNPS